MKSLTIIFALLFSFASFSADAQKSTLKESVTVYGNCGMCKTRIEKAAINAGATAAKWNDESKLLSVSFASSKTSLENIEKAVAAVGHDTKNFSASDEVYNELHGCCQYDRKVTEGKIAMAAACCKTHDKCMTDKCCKVTEGKADCCKATDAKEGCCPAGKSCCAK